MKIFKKIFGDKDQARQKLIAQRSPRVRIPQLEKMIFKSASGKEYRILNISETGLALDCPDEKTSDEMKGQVIFEEQSLHVEIAIVWREKASAGGRFLAGHAEVRGLLRRIFTDELRAMEMSEVDSSRQKALEEGNPKWFHAPGNVELFYVENGGELKRFEVEWGGNVLVWDGKQLRFGTVDPEHRESLSHARSSIVNWSSELSPKILKKALRILENVQGLDAAILERMRGILTPG